MAEEDAEIAFLHQMQMQAGQNGAWGGSGADEASKEEIPSNTELNNEQVIKEENVADDQVLRALSPTASGAESESGDYDPAAAISAVPAITLAGLEESRSSSRASTRKPKTIGGFLADDSSDEEGDPSTPAQTQSGLPTASNTPHRAISPSPLQNSVPQQETQVPAQNQGDSAAQSSFTLPVTSSTAQVSSLQAPVAPALTSTGHAQAVSVPKARLPHDKTGILEDRIKEDPRGDMEAWLLLISEHRKRNKLDDARAVYERFFTVFPHAVSHLDISCMVL